ncbi:hypothetical protein MMC13_002805 [Lambiella insularis]|nr:hypothetical protein [Lambiella insularis]
MNPGRKPPNIGRTRSIHNPIHGIQHRRSLQQRDITDKAHGGSMKLDVAPSRRSESFSDRDSTCESQTSMDSPESDSLGDAHDFASSDPITVALREEVKTIRQEREAMRRRLEEIDARIEALNRRFDIAREQ